MIVGDQPKVSTMMAEFLLVECPTFNDVIKRPLLKALKAVTFIYHLMMKFPQQKALGR